MNDNINDYSFGTKACAAWRPFVNCSILDHILENSEKIGDVGKVLEVDELKSGKRIVEDML